MSAVLDFTLRAAAPASHFAIDVLAGLAQTQKSVPSAWLYDRRGSSLFELITGLPEYYLTRTENWILERCAGAIAEMAGPGATLVELGSGSSRKTYILLGRLDRPSAYVPVDISVDFVAESVNALMTRFPWLRVKPIFADLMRLKALPESSVGGWNHIRSWTDEQACYAVHVLQFD